MSLFFNIYIKMIRMYGEYVAVKSYLLQYLEKYKQQVPTRVSKNIYLGNHHDIDGNFDSYVSLVKTRPLKNQLVFIMKDEPVYKEYVDFDIKYEDIKDLITSLNKIYEFTMNNKNILMHCHKGISRSVFVYLFCQLKNKYRKYRFNKKILLSLVIELRAKRPIAVGDKFIYYLCIIEDCLFENQQKRIDAEDN